MVGRGFIPGIDARMIVRALAPEVGSPTQTCTVLSCYREFMPQSNSSALDWKPVPLPLREPMHGRTVMLEPLDADLHAADLWGHVEGHDEVWQYLFDGPYASEKDLTRDIAEKQAAH